LWNNIVCGVIIGLLAASRVWSRQVGPGVSWVNAIIGIWLIVSSFIWAYAPATATPPTGAAAVPGMPGGLPGAMNAHWNDIVVGVLVLILAAWSAMSGRMA